MPPSFLAGTILIAKSLLLSWPFIMVWTGRGTHAQLNFQTMSSSAAMDVTMDVGECKKLRMDATDLRKKLFPALRALRHTKKFSQDTKINLVAVISSRYEDKIAVGTTAKRAAAKFFAASDCSGSSTSSLVLKPGATSLTFSMKDTKAESFMLFGEVAPLQSSRRGWPRGWKGQKIFGGVFPGPLVTVNPAPATKMILSIAAKFLSPGHPTAQECIPFGIALKDSFNNPASRANLVLKFSTTTGNIYSEATCQKKVPEPYGPWGSWTVAQLYFKSDATLVRPAFETIRVSQSGGGFDESLRFKLHPNISELPDPIAGGDPMELPIPFPLEDPASGVRIENIWARTAALNSKDPAELASNATNLNRLFSLSLAKELMGYRFAVVNGNTCDGAAYSAPFIQKIRSQDRMHDRFTVDYPLTGTGIKSFCVLGITKGGKEQGPPSKYTWLSDRNPITEFDITTPVYFSIGVEGQDWTRKINTSFSLPLQVAWREPYGVKKEDIDRYEVFVDKEGSAPCKGRLGTTAGNSFEVPKKALRPGLYTFCVTAVDVNGARRNSVSRNIVVATEAPSIDLSLNLGSGLYSPGVVTKSRRIRAELRDTQSDLGRFRYKVINTTTGEAGEYGDWAPSYSSYIHYFDLGGIKKDGFYKVLVQVTSLKSGKVVPVPLIAMFKLDTSPPSTFNIVSVPNYSPTLSANGTATATLSWSGSSGAEYFTYFVSTHNKCDAAAAADAIYSSTYVGELSEIITLRALGPQYACVYAYDKLGNVRRASNSPFPLVGGGKFAGGWRLVDSFNWKSSVESPKPEEELVELHATYLRARNLTTQTERRIELQADDGVPFAYSTLPLFFRTGDHKIVLWGGQGKELLDANQNLGDVLVTTKTVLVYDLKEDTWDSFDAGAAPTFVYYQAKPYYHTYKDRYLVTYNPNSGRGSYLDLQLKRVIDMPAGGPVGNYLSESASQSIVGDKFVSCGYATESVNFDYRKPHQYFAVSDRCYIYSLSENRWLASIGPIPIRRAFPRITAMGPDKFAIWGGLEGYRPYPYGTAIFSKSGFIYDFKTGAWTSISTEGSPNARMGGELRWTGKELLMLWGINEDWLPMRSGGLYNPATKSWRTVLTNTETETNGWIPTWRLEQVQDRFIVPHFSDFSSFVPSNE